MKTKPLNLRWIFSCCVFSLATISLSAQDCEMTVLVCNNNINVTLDENCLAEVTPDMVLEGMACDNSFYTVELFDENNNAIGNMVGTAQAGQTINVHIVHNTSGNYCWGTIAVEDKLAPQIICPCMDEPEDCAFLCTDLDMLLAGGGPMASATDACGTPEITFSDEIETATCGDIIITRTFYATDNSGNASFCEQDIFLRPLTLNDVEVIAQIELPCEFDNNVSPEELSAADVTGAYPFVTSDAGTFDLTFTLCNLAVTYYDAPATIYCGNTFQFIRTWNVFDWCTAESATFSQLIISSDTVPPVINTCPDYGSAIPVGFYPDECTGVIPIQDLTDFSENCSSPTTVEVELYLEDGTVLSVAVGEQVQTIAGTHQVVYTVMDDCGNTTTCATPVVIEDQTPPVMICDEHTVIALGSDGNGTICTATFDDYSYDNCGYLVLKVKRMDAPADVQFTDCVDFFCEDIQYDILGNPIPVMVRLRAYDILPENGFPDEADAGRWNECMVAVTVQDELVPVMNCPPDKTVECQTVFAELDGIIPDDDGVVDDDPIATPVYYGSESLFQGYYAEALDNCNATIWVFDEGGIEGNCGEGEFIRTWTITDGAGLFSLCTQTITIQNSSPFNEEDINWPEDAVADCAAGIYPEDLPPGRQEPELTGDACDLLEVVYEDDYFPVVDSACYKILRSWTVYDWCQFDDTATPNPGIWEHIQIIQVMDQNPPEIDTVLSNVTICSYETDCLEPVVFDLNASDLCAEELRYTLHIAGVYDGIFQPGNTLDIPEGVHTVVWVVEDGCDNSSTVAFQLTVLDCKQPTPVCVDNIATVVMPTSLEIALDAAAFNLGGLSGSFDNCTAQEDLIFRVRKVAPDNNELTILPQVLALDSTVTFTCDDLGTAEVELYVIDETGNWDFCTTSAEIADNSGLCPPQITTGIIHGFIETEVNDRVENVMVKLSGDGTNYDTSYTNEAGTYEFEVPLLQNYVITPENNEDPLNGVTTYDLVLVSMHILEVELLDSPYKIIAADANHSNAVTTLDLVYLRRLILNIDTEFASNTSWRFVDKAFEFPNPANPFQTLLPESIIYNNLESGVQDASFIAIKIGDVNNSAIPNLLLETQDRREGESLVFMMQDEVYSAGEIYETAFRAKDFEAISGFQFTLDYDENLVNFMAIETGGLPDFTGDNFGLHPNNAAITCSWHHIAMQSLKDNDLIFKVKFKARQQTTCRAIFQLSDQLTLAEAYRDELAANLRIDYKFMVEKEQRNTDFIVYQNSPNPFTTQSKIAFYLPETGPITLRIFNCNGKILCNKNYILEQGYQEVFIHRDEIGDTGVLYYNLSNGKIDQTKKMIVL